MKLVVNKHRGRLYDLVNTLILYYSKPLTKNFIDDISGDISKIYAVINKELEAYASKELTVFFTENENNQALITDIISNVDLLYSSNIITSEEIVAWMKKNTDTVLSKMLGFYDKYLQDEKIYYNIACDKNKIFNLIKDMPVKDNIKTSLVMFLYNPEKIYEDMEKLLKYSEGIVDRLYIQYSPKIQAFLDRYNDEELKHVLEMCCIEVDKFNKCEVSLSIIAQSDTLIYSSLEKTILILGICFEQAAHYRIKNRVDVDWKSLGRVLSDEKRVKIIELLRNQELYITEIAKAMGMSVTAVWYHLDILSNEKAITMRTEGRKVYHSLNDDFFTSLAHYSSEYCRLLEAK